MAKQTGKRRRDAGGGGIGVVPAQLGAAGTLGQRRTFWQNRPMRRERSVGEGVSKWPSCFSMPLPLAMASIFSPLAKGRIGECSGMGRGDNEASTHREEGEGGRRPPSADCPGWLTSGAAGGTFLRLAVVGRGQKRNKTTKKMRRNGAEANGGRGEGEQRMGGKWRNFRRGRRVGWRLAAKLNKKMRRKKCREHRRGIYEGTGRLAAGCCFVALSTGFCHRLVAQSSSQSLGELDGERTTLLGVQCEASLQTKKKLKHQNCGGPEGGKCIEKGEKEGRMMDEEKGS